MSRRTISFRLSENEIDRAIRELEAYQTEFQQKVDRFRVLVAERLRDYAQDVFDRAEADVLADEESIPSDVTVSVEDDGRVVIARGDDVIFVEFGAGVTYNGSPGASPHPWGQELGYTIGSYDKGRGKQRRWRFKDEDGNVHISYGTPAAMPMARAYSTIINELSDIAKEVFG